MATEYDRRDHTLKEWEAKISEEEARWRHVGMSLDGLNMRGSEIFGLHCKVQAILNALAQEDTSEENLTLNLRMLTFSSMNELREELEPQIARAKLMQGVGQPQPLAPEIIMPWLRKEENGG